MWAKSGEDVALRVPCPTHPMTLALSSHSCKMSVLNDWFNKHMPGPFEVLYKY